MRASQWFLATKKEIPNDAELISHQLMLRAGMIRRLGSGLYTWLPLGLKVLRKVEQIVREEMNRANAMEILMPAIQPAELWKETGRWETFGGLLLTIKDNNDRDYCFGPTHEEVITDLIRHEIHSYKQLPANFYQIQTKFRDEIRPRFGVMRAREFIMKDAYSFHATQESLQHTYELMYDTYCRIFDRLGLNYRVVEADTGAIGGAVSHEFQVLADSGEDLIFFSNTSNYAANVERATGIIPERVTNITVEPISIVDTVGKKTIVDVAKALVVSPKQIIKTLIVEGNTHPLIALVLCGDDELNTIKASKHNLVKSPLRFADEHTIQSMLGGVSSNSSNDSLVGFIGPVGLSIPIIVDHHALAMTSFICGANQVDKHFINAAWDRDASYQDAYDLRNVKEGDLSPDGKGQLQSCRGIEVGHVFQLGDNYTRAMNAAVINEEGQLQTMQMGCYGIGITRIIAAAIEQHHDERGILWPLSMAPFQLVIIPINRQRCPLVKEASENLYQELHALGIEILLDDRTERPGVLFADNDLIGIPHRLIISERHLQYQAVEYKARDKDESDIILLQDLTEFLRKIHVI